MNQKLTEQSVQDFINENLHGDISKLALLKSPFSDISMKELAVQIEGKRKAKEKFPFCFHTKKIIYPSPIAMEQCSSELTADYKASLYPKKRIIDLTGGFGVDSWAFSKQFKEVFYCEKDKETAAVATYNFSLFGAENISVYQGDGIEFLRQNGRRFDLIYIDPSRRDSHNRKMHAFSDCTPDVVANLDLFFEHGDRILIKASPMFDIEKALHELKFVVEIHICAVKNEVREVLYLLERKQCDSERVFTINFLNQNLQQKFSFFKRELAENGAIYSLPLRYLYEPNHAVMKSGAFNLLCSRYDVMKLHKNSHLYTSERFVGSFPGRCFKMVTVLPYKKHEKLINVNVTTRNFPDTPEQVLKKMKVKEGGDDYLFCTTLLDNKPAVLLCEKII
ncbi:MAG: class I SAM-dependent methyltransferase [Bacteroidales bacterium]|jgi:hypothetical protein|nr:class I SAM-dependent methyltransferase [Bacteroidales bacterium]